jgi:hypothetical protein
MDYQKGKIYKIESHLGPRIYIGATTKDRLSQRMASHKNSYNRWKRGNIGRTTSYDIFEEYGFENCRIILLEACPCNSKDELNAKEASYIRTLDCINKKMPNRTQKEYNLENKDKIRIYHETNKEQLKEQRKEYRSQNKEKIKERKSVPFKCECGSCFQVDEKARHQRSKKHLSYLASKTE